MLRRENRLTAAQGFAGTIRRGRRAGTRALVLHLAVGDSDGAERTDGLTARGAEPVGPQVGFVVSKAVGNAVTRNLVKRRLRHLARERLDALPGSTVLVVRALPPSAGSSYDELGRDFDRALERLLRRSSRS